MAQSVFTLIHTLIKLQRTSLHIYTIYHHVFDSTRLMSQEPLGICGSNGTCCYLKRVCLPPSASSVNCSSHCLLSLFLYLSPHRFLLRSQPARNHRLMLRLALYPGRIVLLFHPPMYTQSIRDFYFHCLYLACHCCLVEHRAFSTLCLLS